MREPVGECHPVAVFACSENRSRRHMGEEGGRSATAKKFSPNPDTIRAKATQKVEGRVEPTKTVSAADALVTSERIAEPRLTFMEDHPTSAPKGKGAGSCEEEKPETSQNVPLETIDLGSFEVLSDRGDAAEDDVDVDEFSEEAAGVMPPLPPACLLV